MSQSIIKPNYPKKMFEMVDAHCHLESIKEYVLGSVLPVTCGYSHSSNIKNIEIAKRLSVPFAIGIAPQTAIKNDLKDLNVWIKTITDAKPNAIGEIGLDFHWAKNSEEIEKEKIVFTKMVEIAEDMKLPIVVHSRKAEKECVNWLIERKFKYGVMLHFYSGDETTALRSLELNAMISVAPLHSKERRKVINSIPLENIVIETDSPYVVRKPEDVINSAVYVSEIKKLDIEEVKLKTMKNALNFFRFDPNKK